MGKIVASGCLGSPTLSAPKATAPACESFENGRGEGRGEAGDLVEALP